MRVRVLVNPVAGSGAGTRRLPAILHELERAGASADVAETRAPGDAARLVREAHAEGVTCVAVVGGDGTLNEACQAFVDAHGQRVEGPELALVPAGTGGDFRRTFGLSTEVEEAVTRLVSCPPRPIDLGVVELTAPDGSRIVRAFLNVTSFGLGGLTDRIVNTSPKWLGGRTAFFLGAVRAMLVYRNAPVRVTVDDQVFVEGPILNVALANGRWFGGGMLVAPDADPADGAFDVVAFEDLSRVQGLLMARHIYRGSHVGEPRVSTTRGHTVTAEPLVPADEVLIDLDGETPGRLPLTARVIPGGVRIRI
ncbi:MAG TPA: diacylglycerol kinase family protein [Polyangiaceae bacterium]|nr:diacylglycerol kinase family protein [Polyangiaceae bacterium]